MLPTTWPATGPSRPPSSQSKGWTRRFRDPVRAHISRLRRRPLLWTSWSVERLEDEIVVIVDQLDLKAVVSLARERLRGEDTPKAPAENEDLLFVHAQFPSKKTSG